MKVYDITRPVSPKIAVWPGDRPFRAEWSARIDEENPVNVGAISLSTHTGTHADAPLHFSNSGQSIDQIPLSRFIGSACVVDIGDSGPIDVTHVQELDLRDVPRVLFRTKASGHSEESFHHDFAWIRPEVVHYLGQRGVVLIGTDAPSVDPFDSKDLPAHHALAAEGIVNLENLYLRDVSPGRYQLYALPMKLMGLDGAPVRAVLMG